MSTWTPTVPAIVDGITQVSASTLNPVISALTSRDQYLFDKLDEQNDKSVLMAFDIPINSSITTAYTTVYFSTDSSQLELAVSGFAPNSEPSCLTPSPSSYVFGIVQQLLGTGTADVYVRGLVPNVPLASVLEDPTSTITHGPLYLSYNAPGKLTFDHTGASIFVGNYLGNVNGQENCLFLAPNIDSLDQLYYNYRVYLYTGLVAGTFAFGSGVWTITSDQTKIGWIAAGDAHSYYGYTVPVVGSVTAKYFYNLPAAAHILSSGLSAQQIKDATILKQAIPAYPSSFTELFKNGVLQQGADADHTNGAYCMDQHGIWWFDNVNAPWTTNPSDPTTAQTILVQTTKINPFFKSSVVSTLASFSDSSNNSARVIEVVEKASRQVGTTGDLQLKFNLPVASTSATGNGTAVQGLSYSQAAGQLVQSLAPSVSAIVAGPGLAVSTDSNGKATLSINNYVLTGDVDNLEPEDCDYVYKGLHSYLKLVPPTANQRVGVVGKVFLPQILPSGLSFKVKLLAFGDAVSSAPVSFNLEYAVTSDTSSTGTQISSALARGTYNSSTTINVAGITQNVPKLFSGGTYGAYFEIPAEALVPSGYVNFRIVRVYNASGYTGNFNILGVTWAIEG